ncbi:alpha-L-fucosidase [Pseudobacter ginsenosidimutans]|uniref:alpha-L-fucosidase n=1 Tax=Pseudobacter ginsenosidimutans TaxID=661488 RepID=A0A4Q7MWH4_9BACT|nr:alpha-L-fucosidase [Pseudobacter ginsenosidimutans]QEC40864.1 alpha-L-fucosidase [Pseudobacter ginsenosidimutans]RZS72404.1 alpha-L-fucosidase [Pseudobacter ginsenosidimutans]
MLRIILLLLLTVTGSLGSYAQLVDIVGPAPNARQMEWHQMEFYLFMHFGPNTFTDVEWGKGTEDPSVFNPTELDCRQWARIARDAGAKGIIITAKHHDGFCLWPSRFSDHTVAQSPWKNGKGNVLRELSEACSSYGIGFGVYISPWDRNHPDYGTDEYNDIYVKTMRELLRGYGDIFELWWDGANGEGPNGKKQEYDFPRFERTARRFADEALIFSDIGPDIRWVGNEKGIAGKTNWNLLDTVGFERGIGAPPVDTLNTGNVNGKSWIPAECDVSIRPGWFYHPNEDTAVKSGRELMKIFMTSVGRGSNLLLNVPPDRRGLIHPNDSAALMAFKGLRESSFRENLARRARVHVSSSRAGYLPSLLVDGFRFSHWAPDKTITTCSIELEMDQEKEFNTIMLQEYIEAGQRIEAFTIEVFNDGNYVPLTSGTTVGYKRILQFPRQTASKIRISVTKSKASPVLGEIQVFNCEDFGNEQ